VEISVTLFPSGLALEVRIDHRFESGGRLNTRVRVPVDDERRRALDSKAQAILDVLFDCARVLAAIEAGFELRGIEPELSRRCF